MVAASKHVRTLGTAVAPSSVVPGPTFTNSHPPLIFDAVLSTVFRNACATIMCIAADNSTLWVY